MTYEEIILELTSVNLDKEFTDEFENYISSELLLLLKNTDKINSTGSLIRLLLKKWKPETEQWIYWHQVLFYFMNPDFAKTKEMLPIKK